MFQLVDDIARLLNNLVWLQRNATPKLSAHSSSCIVVGGVPHFLGEVVNSSFHNGPNSSVRRRGQSVADLGQILLEDIKQLVETVQLPPTPESFSVHLKMKCGAAIEGC